MKNLIALMLPFAFSSGLFYAPTALSKPRESSTPLSQPLAPMVEKLERKILLAACSPSAQQDQEVASLCKQLESVHQRIANSSGQASAFETALKEKYQTELARFLSGWNGGGIFVRCELQVDDSHWCKISAEAGDGQSSGFMEIEVNVKESKSGGFEIQELRRREKSYG